MKLKVYSTIVISSLLGFVLIAAAGISTIAFVNAFAQEEEMEDKGEMNGDRDKGMTNGLGNDTGGMSEGHIDPNGEATDLGTGGP